MNVGPRDHVGTVVSFDAQVGLGQIRAAADASTDTGMIGFHCVAIADGSRAIEVGTAVRFTIVAGLHGRWEAAAIAALDPR